MSRSGIRTIVTVALAGYGLYVATYLLPMLPGPAAPGLVALFAIPTFWLALLLQMSIDLIEWVVTPRGLKRGAEVRE